MASKPGDVRDVRPLRVRRKLPHLHVFEHALAKGCHEALLCDTPGEFQAFERSVRGESAIAAGGKTLVHARATAARPSDYR